MEEINVRGWEKRRASPKYLVIQNSTRRRATSQQMIKQFWIFDNAKMILLYFFVHRLTNKKSGWFRGAGTIHFSACFHVGVRFILFYFFGGWGGENLLSCDNKNWGQGLPSGGRGRDKSLVVTAHSAREVRMKGRSLAFAQTAAIPPLAFSIFSVFSLRAPEQSPPRSLSPIPSPRR